MSDVMYFIVSIARTILKNAQILLMDEATSALDTGTEREIQGQLRKLVITDPSDFCFLAESDLFRLKAVRHWPLHTACRL